MMAFKPEFCDEVLSVEELATARDCADKIDNKILSEHGVHCVQIIYPVAPYPTTHDISSETCKSYHRFTRQRLNVGTKRLYVLLCDGKILDSRDDIKGLIKQEWTTEAGPFPSWDVWGL